MSLKSSMMEKMSGMAGTGKSLADIMADKESAHLADTAMGNRWDFVMVLPTAEKKDSEYNWQSIVRRLKESGLEIMLYESGKATRIFCAIRAPFERLKQEADRINYRLMLNPSRLRKIARRAGDQRKPIQLEEDKNVCSQSSVKMIRDRVLLE